MRNGHEDHWPDWLARIRLRRYAFAFCIGIVSINDLWYQQQLDGLSDILQELLADGDPAQAKHALNKAINSWKDYHQKELDKWTALQESIN